jgi:flagellar export protein FliJ
MTGNQGRDALAVVARVRRVREEDSRYGVQLATHEVQEARVRLLALDQRLTVLGQQPVASAGALVSLRTGLLALGDAVREAQAEAESAELLALAAQERWQQDRLRLRTIEMLQERRAEAARVERTRAEAKLQDEVATQLWRRTAGSQVVA